MNLAFWNPNELKSLLDKEPKKVVSKEETKKAIERAEEIREMYHRKKKKLESNKAVE